MVHDPYRPDRNAIHVKRDEKALNDRGIEPSHIREVALRVYRQQLCVEGRTDEPLRDGGLVLFQASFAQLPNGQLESTLAVVKNPSDQWPLISCIIIAVGMLMAFVQKLLRYIEAQKVERSKA